MTQLYVVYICLQMFRQLFEEGLEFQKLRLREQRAYAREQRLERERRHQDQIESLENYYKDQVRHNAVTLRGLNVTGSFYTVNETLLPFQFSLLAEKLAQEREEIQVRKKAQEKVNILLKIRTCSKNNNECLKFIRTGSKSVLHSSHAEHALDIQCKLGPPKITQLVNCMKLYQQ